MSEAVACDTSQLSFTTQQVFFWALDSVSNNCFPHPFALSDALPSLHAREYVKEVYCLPSFLTTRMYDYSALLSSHTEA